jgi:hypothetical protein
MKKLFKLVVLASLGYVLYKRYQRKSACLDLIKAVPDMVDAEVQHREGSSHSHHKSGFHQELDTSVTVDTVVIPFKHTLVWKWLAKHPDVIVGKAGHSGRREGQGKYAPIFNALKVWEQHIFETTTIKSSLAIRGAMNNFQRKYGGEFHFSRSGMWNCIVTRNA